MSRMARLPRVRPLVVTRVVSTARRWTLALRMASEVRTRSTRSVRVTVVVRALVR